MQTRKSMRTSSGALKANADASRRPSGGAPVFMASSAFNLRYEQEHWPKLAFADVKGYQKAAA